MLLDDDRSKYSSRPTPVTPPVRLSVWSHDHTPGQLFTLGYNYSFRFQGRRQYQILKQFGSLVDIKLPATFSANRIFRTPYFIWSKDPGPRQTDLRLACFRFGVAVYRRDLSSIQARRDAINRENSVLFISCIIMDRNFRRRATSRGKYERGKS